MEWKAEGQMSGIICVGALRLPHSLAVISASHFPLSLFACQQGTRLVYGRHFATEHLGLDFAWSPRALRDGKCREVRQEEGAERGRSKELQGDTQTEPHLHPNCGSDTFVMI